MSFESDILKTPCAATSTSRWSSSSTRHETVRPRRLQRIGAYASAVGLSKHLALPRYPVRTPSVIPGLQC